LRLERDCQLGGGQPDSGQPRRAGLRPGRDQFRQRHRPHRGRAEIHAERQSQSAQPRHEADRSLSDDAVATWTPGDVMAVKDRSSVNYKGRGERVQKIVSTKEYSYMMPHILFGNEDWLNRHRDYVKTLLRCFARSNERIKTDEAYFRDRVAALNALVFNMEGKGPTFWHTYFNGRVEDGVPLGGSRVNNIAEVRHLFGLDSNQPLERSIFGVSYLDHGKRLQRLLPERLPTITPVAQVVDLSFI